ncbi:D-alanine--D-alanine ligase [Sulfurovum sp. NBC37-1]|uniref:D-alanine--D-alanine ligase n=1 Tax=Sulfurovum sp. (strain NBC37-1) TaxID=387093 RepID=DDL_SULNB|nr:D-alanine--D-alanine ligase [Sulfurovum sp. NBC37-1]A6Q6M8.1 RecName: Full=D-alanine--D-alanine ligase; AltName: Full=D-Ala-D-Ala ligase; AltName: Full=D-alanylalanine synthetase [Sulfurovum sp. NBC37-1]BAF71137.1 D-alanine-D-alanine ligase [Sulfurovum sp. NBC37-1]
MNIAILFGGSSFEHEISIVSAITMKKVLKKSTLTYIFVSADRKFYLIDTEKINSKLFSSGEYKKGKQLVLKNDGFFTKGMFGSKQVAFDVLLNLIHGRDGEDGKVASMMEFFNIPYISPRLEASAMSYNKLYTKFLAESLGVKTVPYEHLSKNGDRKISMEYPVIIKPVRLGSSIGVSIVKSEAELDYALDVAFEFDNDVIVEPFIDGVKEFNQAGCHTGDWELSIVEEPQKEEFLDFEKKYMDFSRDSQVLSADISEELKNNIQVTFKKIYDPLFMGSIIRCDFFVVNDEILLNEINPIPGSMANYLFPDFEGMVWRLSKALPKEKNISIDYTYIHSIQSAKGKA